MKLSRREGVLGAVALVVAVSGATYWWAAPRVETARERVREMEALTMRIEHARRLVAQRGAWLEKWEALRRELPQHPAEKDVTGEILRQLEQTAQQHGLSLLRREPGQESALKDLYEVTIDCTWEGTLEALVHFLYAIQLQGVILDIRNLNVTPAEGAANRLKGTFTVAVAYTRAPAEKVGAGPPP